MAANTPNFDLRMPTDADEVDVDLDIADNMLKIDTALQGVYAGTATLAGAQVDGDVEITGNLTVAGLGVVGGGGVGLVAASPFTVAPMPNLLTEEGSVSAMIFAEDNVLLSAALEGDEFPRFMISVDPGNFGSLYFGNGTIDPVGQDGASLLLANNTGDPDNDMTLILRVRTGNEIRLMGRTRINGELEVWNPDDGSSLVIRSPNSTKYRIKVANDGTLSTEELP